MPVLLEKVKKSAGLEGDVKPGVKEERTRGYLEAAMRSLH